MPSLLLPDLPKDAPAQIEAIEPNPDFGALDAAVTRRLADLGFSAGMSITIISNGLLGRGPYAVRLGNQSQFALRTPEARKIRCRATAA